MSQFQHYQFTSFQADRIHTAASRIDGVFLLVHPREGDTPEQYAKLADEARQIQDLVSLGLVEDVTAEFQQQIAKLTLQYDRRYQIVRVTDTGFLMFQGGFGADPKAVH